MSNSKGRFSNLDFNAVVAPPRLSGEADPWPNQDGPACVRDGDTHFNKGAYEPALTNYSRALRFDRNLVTAWAGQIRCLLRLHELLEARTWSDRALEKFSSHPELLAAKGLTLVLDGDTVQGMEFLDGAVQERNPTAWAWLHRAEGLLILNEPSDNASRCLLKAQEMHPSEAGVWLQSGLIWMQTGHAARARHPFMEALRLDPANPFVMLQCGLNQELLGQKEAAAGYFERALALRPGYRLAEDALQRVRRKPLFGFLRR